MSTDEARKQYFMFAVLISVIVSFFLNFTLIGSLPGPFVSGFPLNAYDAVGSGLFFVRIINSLTLGALLSVPMYYLLNWVLTRSGGY